jgi:hypothetical protein
MVQDKNLSQEQRRHIFPRKYHDLFRTDQEEISDCTRSSSTIDVFLLFHDPQASPHPKLYIV